MTAKERTEIYVDAQLTLQEISQVDAAFDGYIDFYETTAYTKLFNYFLDAGEMPYGVAKFRTGEADEWILEQLTTWNCF